MKDLGVKYTDAEIIALEKQLIALYSECSKEIQQELDTFMAKFEKKNKEFQRKLKTGEVSMEEYQRWLKGQVFQGKQWQYKKESIANTLANVNQVAINMANEKVPNVFQLNGNYAAYQMEHTKGVDFGFNLYNSTTVKEIVAHDIDILPYKKLNKAKDIRWNFQNIKNIVAKGIIKGAPLGKIATELAKEMPNRNYSMVRTHARTMLTSAQNQGRLTRFEEAQDKGLKMKKQWFATLDEKTRYTHRELDGQLQDLDKPFKVEGYEIMMPADPHAHPSLVYNCRCTMNSFIEKYPPKYTTRRDNQTKQLIDHMTYNEWVKWKESQGV